MLSSFLCNLFFRKREQPPWQEIEEEAKHLQELASWTASNNALMFQAFEWHVPDDRAHWSRLQQLLPSLKAMGVDNIWIPPGCKPASTSGNGYDIYDLYDLGAFDQKGSVPTKWGTKQELQNFALAAQNMGIGVYWDAVLNHKAGADCLERFLAVKVDPQDRNQEVSPAKEIAGWVGFEFPGRGDQYSPQKYGSSHFSGVDWDDNCKERAIFKISGPNRGWATDVSIENGNYDYLMFSDIDYSNPDVREDVLRWGKWISDQLPLSGMRLDAVKHYSASFQKEFIASLRKHIGERFFFVGEYWKAELDILMSYLEIMEFQLSLFDVPLLDRFSIMSQTDKADMRQIFRSTLVARSPDHAVTFVTNHDTQPGQSLEAPVASFFKPLAYALILLRESGQPCVFYGDLYGISGDNEHSYTSLTARKLPILMQARKLYANGAQRDYFEKKNCIGFVRYGNLAHPFGLACIMSNAGTSRKRMFVGTPHVGEEWTDILRSRTDVVTINKKGYGVFPVGSYSVSVWVNSSPECRRDLQQNL
ncbi:glycoside hydrolase superfamily [Aspergillus karnatakaensis]|uniref:alpha-amylase n=1 Tax=Aspergillus karnatakaensis TaxID=1810916 RepID=UPI003CCD2EC8